MEVNGNPKNYTKKYAKFRDFRGEHPRRYTLQFAHHSQLITLFGNLLKSYFEIIYHHLKHQKIPECIFSSCVNSLASKLAFVAIECFKNRRHCFDKIFSDKLSHIFIPAISAIQTLTDTPDGNVGLCCSVRSINESSHIKIISNGNKLISYSNGLAIVLERT